MINFFYIKEEYRLPPSIVIAVVVICVVPFILQLLGGDFGNALQVTSSTEAAPITADDMFYRLSGGFTHALLEWTAFSAAIFVVLLAFCHCLQLLDQLF